MSSTETNPEVPLMYVLESTGSPHFSVKRTRLEKNHLDETRHYNFKGGFIQMTELKKFSIDSESDLVDSELCPNLINEFPLGDGENVENLIQTVANSYQRIKIIRDKDFWTLRDINKHLMEIHQPYELIMLDISEFEWARHHQDIELLKAELNELYSCLGALITLGTICIVIVNARYYDEIHDTCRSDVNILARPYLQFTNTLLLDDPPIALFRENPAQPFPDLEDDI
ncbi:MAG: hypothetical protein ACTSRC_14695 [Candidatus Helarchaeota archaeon]